LAVYKYRLVFDGGPVAIPRFLDTDADGIWSFGETSAMETRRRRFCKSIRGGYGHPSGKLLALVSEFGLLSKKFPECTLQYTFTVALSKPAAKEKEDELILCYILKYGEPPPANSTIPDRWNEYGLWAKCAALGQKLS
jgi:hypothetical protein